MCGTCAYASRMPIMIQIRNVPEVLHRRIKARAALAGMSLSEYLLKEIERALERPTRRELLERISARPGARLRQRPADALRAEREAR